MPEQAVKELGIHPGDDVHVRVEAASRNGDRAQDSMLSRARYAMAHRTPEQIAAAQARAIENYRPIRTVQPDKTLWDIVSGQWPGDETDEQIEAALREIS